MSSKTILVVDDYEDLRKLVAFFLSGRGYEILEAPKWSEGHSRGD